MRVPRLVNGDRTETYHYGQLDLGFGAKVRRADLAHFLVQQLGIWPQHSLDFAQVLSRAFYYDGLPPDPKSCSCRLFNCHVRQKVS